MHSSQMAFTPGILSLRSNLTHPEFRESKNLYVEIVTVKGSDEGRTVVVEGESPNLPASTRIRTR